MGHHSLIATIVVGLCLAFVFGAIVQRLRLPLLVGYLLAGVAIGPFTPGYIADQAIAPQLAEIGIVLLMFGVGLHFSLKDLLSVKAVAVPGALGQMVFVSALGAGLAHLFGWSIGAGVIFGLSLSVASTVVVLRAMQERRLVDTERGRIVVGWLIVEDLAMILVLVLFPAVVPMLGGVTPAVTQSTWLQSFFEPTSIWGALGVTFVKLAVYMLVMLVVGRRVIPIVLHYVAHTGSRELFRLAVLAVALGVAFASAELFDVSFALGAFFAGMVLAESTLSQQAAQETLPLRDAFAVLFFVSVGMLFDPSILIREPLPLLGTVALIVFGNAFAAFAVVYIVRRSALVAFTSAAALSQIGEFSFILAGLGVSSRLLPESGRDLVLAAALLSILVNPLLFMVLDRLRPYLDRDDDRRIAPQPGLVDESELPVTTLTDHVVLVGCGRVGGLVVDALLSRKRPFLVIDDRREIVHALRKRGIEAVTARAGHVGVLRAANLKRARYLVSAIPNPFEGGNLVEMARAENPNIQIIARAHFDEEVAHLEQHGADIVIMGEREIAHSIVQHLHPAGAEGSIEPRTS